MIQKVDGYLILPDGTLCWNKAEIDYETHQLISVEYKGLKYNGIYQYLDEEIKYIFQYVNDDIKQIEYIINDD